MSNTPLPEPAIIDRHIPTNIVIRGYTADQMHAHAAAVSADMDEKIAQLRQYLDAAQRRGEGLREQVVALQNQVIHLTKILDDAGIDA